MTKTQENNLCSIMGRIARSLERIARAVDKPDDGEKTDVIRCKDCKYWRNRRITIVVDAEGEEDEAD